MHTYIHTYIHKFIHTMHTSTLASLTAVLLGVLGVAEPAHMHTRTNASNQKHFVPNMCQEIVYYLQYLW